MGVVLTAGAIAIAVAVGVWSERRYPQGAANASRRALLALLYVLLPPVIFFNLAKASIDSSHAVGLVLALVAVTLTSLLTYLVATRFLRLPRHQTGAVLCAVLSVNTGYLGYPLTVALLGRGQLSTAVLYDVLVTGPSLLLGAFAVGAAFGTKAGDTPRQRIRAFFTRNPPLYPAIAGLLAPASLAPEFLVDLSQALIVAILPIGFFAVGVTLAAEADRDRVRFPPPVTGPVAVAVLLKLLLPVGILFGLSAAFVDVPHAYLTQAAMAAGINNLVVASEYGLDRRLAAAAIFWTTVIVVSVGVVVALL